MTEPIINHDEAWDLSCYKRKDHNSARCYIKAIEWIARAGAVLPLIEREAGSDLAKEVSWLLRNEPRLSAEKRGEVTAGDKHED